MKNEKCQNLVRNLHDKEKYDARVGTLKQELNHGLVLKNKHKIIKYTENVMLKV